MVVRQTKALTTIREHIANVIGGTFSLGLAFLAKEGVFGFLDDFVERSIEVKAFTVEVKFDVDVGTLIYLNEFLDVQLHKVLVFASFVCLQVDRLFWSDLLHDVLLLEFCDFLLHQLLALVDIVHVLVQFCLRYFARHQLKQVFDFSLDQLCFFFHSFVQKLLVRERAALQVLFICHLYIATLGHTQTWVFHCRMRRALLFLGRGVIRLLRHRLYRLLLVLNKRNFCGTNLGHDLAGGLLIFGLFHMLVVKVLQLLENLFLCLV